ncbi:hypothetical protein CRE_25943 [Caenorhabditis remanei]|uniref:DUF38 domain-containing protein n=1 Tax=Caenorhabditis remanei TaxID=31234 RepID=E3NK15_CAERE|nr:hypothetical protein CRE_25943 [Caenorhabditis remanei]
MRFSQGKYDLDYDRSFDPKTRSFIDLPPNVMERIGRYLDLRNRFNLRIAATEEIKCMIDSWDPKITEIEYIHYLKSHYSRILIKNKISSPFEARLYEYSRLERDNLMSVLKNPKLRLDKLKIRCYDEKWRGIIEELSESNHKLLVKKYEMTNKSSKGSITLDFLEPSALEEVNLYFSDSAEKMTEIVKSEQCQGLKMLTIKNSFPMTVFPFESFYNCPRFTLVFYSKICEERLVEFIKNLMNTAHLEICHLKIAPNKKKFETQRIGQLLNREDTIIRHRPNLRRYPIEKSREFYEIEFGETSIRVERKK